jgi:hypothetical protein
MGQYYLPCSLQKKESVYSHDFGNGLKLMEHSWIGNNFVHVVERLIAKGGAWFGTQIEWCGDYAEPEIDENGNPCQYEYEGKMYDENLYNRFRETNIKPTFEPLNGRKLRFLKNLDTKEFVDLNRIPADGDGWRIHPLPLLTCNGNGQGGGDYLGKDPNGLVGKWARNRVVIQRNRPRSGKEIVFDLVE